MNARLSREDKVFSHWRNLSLRTGKSQIILASFRYRSELNFRNQALSQVCAFRSSFFGVLSEIAIFLQPVWYKCSAMAEIDTALAANRDAVEQMIRAGEQSGTAWITPRAPGKWSPSQIVEHVARGLEEGANIVAGRPSTMF